MPLTRYQIRNEYGLADPELYKAAERDDPEALLEGVAMAGLVGVLRQLGDLAEFAAEIFHDLHEEVMATAARGHGLMARVQQIEADFPSIEKAFLSQTSHLQFFSAPGVDWHPNLRSEQNLVTRGDLPRFVMDSYEECRGPPRLFLLDKFDIAGAGACLKRYTDPSFFKVEARTLEVPTGDVQREKKTRKVKKKAVRMRNGETSEIAPSSHAKLHQLLQEERIDNGSHDPSRAVKLKKRQLNGYPFDSEIGKSYMVKFVETPSPEHRVVCEVPVNLPRLKFRSDHNSETTVKVLEINTASPVRKSLQRDERSCSPPYAPKDLYKPSIYELKEKIINKASEVVPELSSDGETDETPSSLPEVMDKREFAVGGDSEGGREGSVDGYLSDDVTSEVDNYMDALTTMESEMETDNENKAKNGLAVLNLEKHGIDSDVYEEQLELQAHFSDSQSIGNCSASDDGNRSFKKGRSSFAYSDSPSNLAENTPSDGDGTDKVSPSNENCIDEFMETPTNKFSTSAEILKSKSDELKVPNDTYVEEVENPETRETYCGLGKFVEKPSDCTQFSTRSSDADETETNLTDSRAVSSGMPSLNGDHTLFAVPDETHTVDGLDDGGLDDISDAPLILLNVSEGASEQKGSDYSGNEMLQASNYCTENFDSASGDVGTSHSVSPANEKLLCSALPQVEVFSANLENLAPSVDVPQTHSCPEQRFSGIPDDTLQLETDLDEISGTVDGQETGGQRCNVDGSGREAAPLELPCNYPNVGHEDRVNLDDMITETVQAEDVAPSVASADSTDNGVNGVISSYSDMKFSPRDLVSSHESFSDLGDQHQKGLKFKEAISPEYIDSEVQEDVNQIEVASTDSVELLDDVQDVSLVEQDQYSLHFGDTITTSIASQLRNEESEPTSPQPDNLLENSEDALPSSTCLQETGVSVQQISRFEDDQVHTENLQVDKEQIQSPTYKDQELCFDVSKSSPRDLNQAPFSEFSQQSATQEIDAGTAIDLPDHVLPNHVLSEVTPGNHDSSAFHPADLTLLAEFVPQSSIQEANGANQATGPVDSSLPNFGLYSVANEANHSTEFCSDNLPRQRSSSAFLLQPAGQDNQVAKQAMGQIDSGLPFFGIFPVATQDQLEVPPLPPLPPMQWRMGKVHNAPLASLRDSIQLSQDSHTSVLSSAADDEVKFGFTAPERETLQPQIPFLPHIVLEDERPQHNFECVDGNSVQLASYSSQTPNMVNDLAEEGSQSLNSFPTISHDRAAHGALTSGGELMQSSSNPFPPVSADEDATSRYDPVSSQENQMQLLNQLATETAGNATTLQYISKDLQGQGDTSLNTSASPQSIADEQRQNGLLTSGGEIAWYSNASAPPQSIADEQPQNSLLTSGGEIAWYSNASAFVPFFEIPKPNGKSTLKIPRPRSPLIDAVAAHDKSTLRKVTERVRPQIEPKVDDRDSLLQQIRTKSFNLKPAVVTRPSIQGPKTNLKVAAILEKANAIRQALAGSDDEDDDSDSWSDS